MSLPLRYWHVAWSAPRLPGEAPSERHRNFTDVHQAAAQIAMIRLLEAHDIGRLIGVWTCPAEWSRMDPDALPVNDATREHYQRLAEAWENLDG